MIMTNSSLVAPLLQVFFTDYLCHQKRVSPQTIISYRDTFRLLLTFLRDITGIEPCALRVVDLDAPAVLRFLDHLEQQRGNTVSSRNVRLSAIRSFFRLVALRDPESIGFATRVLAIPVKREDKKLIGYLTRTEVQALLAAPDRSQWAGQRDHALFSTLYNSGARVSEIIALKRDHICFGATSFLQLTGKGRKERTVPLWRETSKILKAWFRKLGNNADSVAFPNARGKPLSRDGVDYLLKQAVRKATIDCPSLATKTITPHIVRHATAMHLLQAGVDIATIALWLGHESIETTHVYIEADLALKEKALGKLDPVDDGHMLRFKADDSLLEFLASL
jgi:site-specific recombinase XerD